MSLGGWCRRRRRRPHRRDHPHPSCRQRRQGDGPAEGPYRSGEDAETAALREVRGGGIEAEIIEKLGDVRYWYQRGGRSIPKQVSFFMMRYLGGSPDDHDDEVEWRAGCPGGG